MLGLQLPIAAFTRLQYFSRVPDPDFVRWGLQRDVNPRETLEAVVSVDVPDTPGRYRLKVDLVSEGVTWFKPCGTVVAIVPLREISDSIQMTDGRMTDGRAQR